MTILQGGGVSIDAAVLDAMRRFEQETDYATARYRVVDTFVQWQSTGITPGKTIRRAWFTVELVKVPA